MGDYLKLVSEKALGRTTTIQPRLPSLFEPVAGLPFRRSRIAEDHVEETAQPPVSGIRPLPAKPDRNVEEILRPEVIRQVPEEKHPGETKSKDVTPPEEPLPPWLVAEVPQPWRGQQVRERDGVADLTNAPAQRPRPEIARREPESPRAQTLLGSVPPMPALPGNMVLGVEHRQAVTRVVERVRQVNQGSDRTLSSASPPHRASSEPRGKQGFEEVPEPDRPVINVVIGRVNVNAVSDRPAAPPRPHASVGPSLSLEQYLKQREGRQ